MLEKILERYDDGEILIADGLNDAIIGFDSISMRVIYSISKCIDILEKTMNNQEEAIEYFYFNVSGAYVGKRTPIFCEDDF